MNKNRKLILQVFAAPDNLTMDADIDIRVREIDFVTSFAKNMQALLDIMGITRMIEKPNGSVLKTRTVIGELQDGNVGEGEEIPLSKYTVNEEIFDEIKLEKYRKAVSIEAIANKGVEAALDETDEEFKSDLRNKVMDKFYTQLKNGSLVGHETTFQMAIAMAIGKTKAMFEQMHRTVTGIAVWVNTLDVYKYVGAAEISVQTSFGMSYLTNFLGADIVFMTTEIPENVVVSTPLNNLIAYYVDPANSEFKKGGLTYTTDPQARFVGFHMRGNYERAISDLFAIMGLRIMCEYQNAITHISVGGSDTQKLKSLTVKSEAGTDSGYTKVTVDAQLQSINNVWKYKTKSGSAESVTYGSDVKTWTRWDGESEIEATTGEYITIVECDRNYKAVSSGSATVASKA